jgi:hypothetical protein
MERALGVLLEAEAQKGLSLSGAVVRQTASGSNNHYTEFGGKEMCTFHTSKHWFENFMQQIGLHI